MQQHCNLILNERGTLWLGDYESALNLEFLKSKGIRTVITVAAGLNLKYEGIVHHKIEILDIELTNISQYFQTANDWIERGFNIGGVLGSINLLQEVKFIAWQVSPDLQLQQLLI
ncbi:unnamed protein product [Paramecium primaurelia]|uniref:Uncharacterized protein n=1 Tax=Paramecium primaurelia TaxID=5886 RepID=A0A8S1M469_PARPR|nr:unnamed protein product [Paramecium primaurelia]